MLTQGLVVSASAAETRAGNVTKERLLSKTARDNNWLVSGGNFESQHFSPLKSITDKNVNRLGLAWSADVDSVMGLAVEPIVVDGVIYIGLPLSIVEAYDGATGQRLWRYDPKIRLNGPWRNSYEGRKNRGVAVWKGKVYVGTGDCRIVAIDAAKGTKVWETVACDADQTGITESPRVGNGLVYTGWSGMEYNVRGGVVALDAETGKKAWTFWTAPGDPSKPYESKTLSTVAKTWEGDSWRLAGTNVWTAITYDHINNLVLLSTSTTGYAVGDFVGLKSKGNQLFANSVVAVNATTGEYVWHYQTAYPPDGSEEFHTLIANMKIAGKDRRVVMTKPRNGVFYMLDARTGAEVLPPRGIDGSYYPSLKQFSLKDLENGYADPGKPADLPAPKMGGGWFPLSYNAQTGLVYISAYAVRSRTASGPNTTGLEANRPSEEHNPTGDTITAKENSKFAPYPPLSTGKLVAYDPIKQKPRWISTLPLEINGGPLATAGNVVFHGDGSGYITAYQAENGKVLWSVKSGSAIQSVPVSYTIKGEQYVLVPVGLGGGYRLFGSPNNMSTLESKRGPARLLAFKLDGKASMPPIQPVIPPVPRPPEQKGTPEQIAHGAEVYKKYFCQKCHSPEADGSGARVLNGEVPDLRYMTADVHREFLGIVLGGSRKELGMPSFSVSAGYPLIKTTMSVEEAQAVYAYIVELQWRAYTLGPRGLKKYDGPHRDAEIIKD